MPDTSLNLDSLRTEVALACRLLAWRGLAPDILGHVSARVSSDRLLVRCRGPQERGLLFTVTDDVRLVDLDGREITDVLADPHAGEYAVPNELPIHTEIYRIHPEVRAVVHAHPPDVVTAGLAGVELRSIFGAFNIPAARLAAGGISTYPRSVLIRRPALAREMVAAMGSRPACVLRGHGLVTTGAGVADAVLRALDVDTLARMSLRVIQAGGTTEPIPDADLAELPDLGAGFNEAVLWRHHVAMLEAAGHGLDR